MMLALTSEVNHNRMDTTKIQGNRVSVIIPTFNRSHIIMEAIESALAQTIPCLEVIVVDDGSTDNTRERLAPYMDRIVYIYQENQGVSAARNTGVRAAKGDLVAFLDSDDVWHPRKLELQVLYLHEHPETALVGAIAFDDPTRAWPALPADASLPAQPAALEDVALRPPFLTSTAVVRKHCFDKIGYFDTDLRNAEDRDLYIRIGSRYRIVKLDIVLVWVGRDENHLSMGSAKAEQTTRKMILRAFDRVEPLRGRFFLRRQALGQVAFEASVMYLAKGNHLRALSRIIRSLILWPLPYRRDEFTQQLARVKTLIVVLLRILRLKQ
jgi:glycosyltransferase involved in cell wall biosynthesis